MAVQIGRDDAYPQAALRIGTVGVARPIGPMGRFELLRIAQVFGKQCGGFGLFAVHQRKQ